MKGIGHTVFRILRSPAFLVITILLFIFSAIGAASGLAIISSTKQDVVLYGVVSFEGKAYLDSYVTNYLGNPKGGDNLTVTLFGPNDTGRTMHVVSGDNGYANLSLGNASNLSHDFVYASLHNTTLTGLFPIIIPGGPEIYLGNLSSSSYAVGMFRDSPGSYYSSPIVVYFNQTGNLSPPVRVYIETQQFSSFSVGPPVTNTTVKGPYSNFSAVRVLGEYGNYTNQGAIVQVNSASNNTTLIGAYESVYSIPPGFALVISFLGVIPAIGGFFMMLVALLAVSAGYSKDESTGSIEMELTKKLTRRDLLIWRYISAAIVMTGVIVGFVGMLEGIFFGIVKASLPAGFIVSLLVGLLVPVLSIMAFPFLFGHGRRMRDVGSVLILFAMVITAVVVNLVISILASNRAAAQALSPLVLLTPVNIYDLFLNAFYPGLASFSGINLIPPGVYPYTGAIIAAAVLWVLGPIYLFYIRGDVKY